MKKDMMLSLDTVRLRFKVLGPSALTLYPITLDKGSQDVAVSRDFMAAEYGGSIRSTCPNIAKHHLEKHGMDDFIPIINLLLHKYQAHVVYSWR